MDIREATRKLDLVQARKRPVCASLLGVPVTLLPMAGNMFTVTLSMAEPGAMDAARRLNDVGADIKPWPAKDRCQARMTWDTTLHYLAMTEDLLIS